VLSPPCVRAAIDFAALIRAKKILASAQRDTAQFAHGENIDEMRVSRIPLFA